MYSNQLHLTQEMMKPMIEFAANNTAFSVKMITHNAQIATKQLEDNLAHLKAMASAEDLNSAMQLQKDFLKTNSEAVQSEIAANYKIAQQALMDFSKVAQDAWKEVKSQLQDSVQSTN